MLVVVVLLMMMMTMMLVMMMIMIAAGVLTVLSSRWHTKEKESRAKQDRSMYALCTYSSAESELTQPRKEVSTTNIITTTNRSISKVRPVSFRSWDSSLLKDISENRRTNARQTGFPMTYEGQNNQLSWCPQRQGEYRRDVET